MPCRLLILKDPNGMESINQKQLELFIASRRPDLIAKAVDRIIKYLNNGGTLTSENAATLMAHNIAIQAQPLEKPDNVSNNANIFLANAKVPVRNTNPNSTPIGN